MDTPRSRKASAAAVAADGLNALDRDRASSLADEGGASASAVEGDLASAAAEESAPDPRSSRAREGRARLVAWPAAVLFAAGAVAAWGWLRRRGRA